MSRTTAQMLGLASLVLALAAVGLAEAATCGMVRTTAELVTGQTGDAGATGNAKQQVADLLRRARQAISEKNWQAADILITRAESLNVQFSALDIRADRPAAVRRDLGAAMQADQGGGANLFGLGQGGPTPPTTSPFTPGGTGAGQARPLPPITDPPAALPTGTAQSMPAAQPAPNLFLRSARLALAEGDLARAGTLLTQAKNRPTNYRPTDDTPEKVQSALERYAQVVADTAGRRMQSEAYRRSYAKSLLQQADELCKWGEYERAERLANAAAAQRVAFSPYELGPSTVLQRINAARGAAGATIAGTSPLAAPPSGAAINQCQHLVTQAQQMLYQGKLDDARRYAVQAQRLGVPDAALPPGTASPSALIQTIDTARANGGGVQLATGMMTEGNNASQALYNPALDTTHNQQASGLSYDPSIPTTMPGYGPVGQEFGSSDLMAPTPAPPQPMDSTMTMPTAIPTTHGAALFEQGVQALKARQADRAYELFRQAHAYADQLDPIRRQRLQDYLQTLSPEGNAPANMTGGPTPTAPIAPPGDSQQLMSEQMQFAVAQANSKALQLRDQGRPRDGLALLQMTMQKLAGAGLDPTTQEILAGRLTRTIEQLEQYILQMAPEIERIENNDRVRAEIAADRRLELEIEQKLAIMVDDFNRLMDAQQYAEAERLAKEAQELAPFEPIVRQLVWQSRFTRRVMNNYEIRDAQEQGFMAALGSVTESAIPFDDRAPIQYPNPTTWGQLTERRAEWRRSELDRVRSEAEMEIDRKLQTPVGLEYQNAPLSEVLNDLGRMADVNIFLDPTALAAYGVDSTTPVTIAVRRDIMLKSALNLILEPLSLGYVIEDEVLKITTKQGREGDVYVVTYAVADLVIPIPNFVPSQNMGLQAAYNNALRNMGFASNSPMSSIGGGAPLGVIASGGDGSAGQLMNPNLSSIMAQIGGMGGGMGGGLGGGPLGGAGGAAGGTGADFDSLIDLITSTIEPNSWQDVGGPGSIAPFPTSLSLVVSQTQDVHEELTDLLEQLRRHHDLQVTIEVRFITLNDNFFERIGVDFDFDINDKIDRPFQVFGRPIDGTQDPLTGTEPFRNTLDQDFDRSVTVGLQAPGVFSADLDIPFTQNSFGLAVPQFGGFDATAGAQLGFAILSDIEAFFFISAAQGDRRSNVLQAPKVTLFNGQQAMVSDTSQSPFVISVVPVVGDFAAAQQPVIVVLSEGTFMTVQAVVSQDRRYVRLTVVPFFSQITNVDTFVFNGGTTTTTNVDTNIGEIADVDNPDIGRNNASDSEETTTSQQGTTVQLPTFSFVTVTTTVSVPDGGTVLLGGIKRLSEGRNEFGTPILDKIPYINRLFKNVGIGRETQSLMMMVTPRIIIQEEEEENIGVLPPS